MLKPDFLYASKNEPVNVLIQYTRVLFRSIIRKLGEAFSIIYLFSYINLF